MPPSNFPADDSLPPDDVARIIAFCGLFEADWKAGQPRRIEDEVAAADERTRSRLFRELLALEFELTYRDGRPAILGAYLARFPDRPDIVRDLFSKTLVPSRDVTGPVMSEEPALAPEGYELLRKLGEGGQATTYLARDRALQRLVVLKRYHGAASSGRREAVLNEGRALARVRSPFVAPCYAVETHGDEIDLVVEYVPGRPLCELTADERADSRHCARLVEQVAGGLAEVHACGLLHRDIKPQNIILGDDKVPRLVDFGLAIPVASEALHAISGSPPYMAPEQARGQGERVDARTDVYGLGAVLYYLLTGQPPHGGKTRNEILEQARDAPIVPPRRINLRTPRALERVCLKATAADPQSRFQAAEALRRALRRYRLMRRAAPVLGAVAVLLALLVPAWAFWPGFGRQSPDRSGRANTGPATAESGSDSKRVSLEGLRVKLFEIRHDPTVGAKHRKRNGVKILGRTSFAAQVHDGVTVRAELSEPAYSYLIAFRPDGTDELCDPDDENVPPPSKLKPRYPPLSKSEDTYGLTEGAGLHAFALVVSHKPLLSYHEWKRRIGPMPWAARLPCEPGVVWRDADAGLEPLLDGDPDDIRGKGVKTGGSGAPVAKLASWLRGLPGVDVVTVEAFLVEPAAEPRP